jgi:Tfp pilus assembly protein PilF
MKTLICSILLAGLLGPAAALAADTGPSSPPPSPPKEATPLDRGRDAIAQQDWARAKRELGQAVQGNPRNADAHNLYAYSIRKGVSPDMHLVFKHYNEALALDPKHRGAHEYLGEAYLMVGNVAKAREHLAQLDKLCFFGCGEYNELKSAIAEHEKKVASR